MRPLSTCELLAIWEQGAAQTLVQRALALLAAAMPDVPVDTLAALPVGRRDGRLLQLRTWLFGSRLESTAVCPACGEQLEISFYADDVTMVPPEGDDNARQVVAVGDYIVHFRLPNSHDLLTLPFQASAQQLLQQCLLAVTRNGVQEVPPILPDRVVQAVANHMAVVDPQADFHLKLACPACSHAWSLLFDIVSFFWQEIEAWAVRTLHQVHVLAAAYGWREQDILTMSAGRRQLYLQMVAI